jgi:hypothetical protein
MMPAKYDICNKIAVVDGGDIGKKSVINHITSFHRFIPPINTTV